MSQNDPFIMVRDAVSKSMTETEELFNRWRDIHTKPYLGSTQELAEVTKQLRERLKGIEWDLEDLDETVKVVESNPDRYRVDTSELKRRKIFIYNSAAKVKVTNVLLVNKEVNNYIVLSGSTKRVRC